MQNWPKQLIVTGTDTGIGKTIVAALLAKALNATYFKPIQTGDDCDSQTVSTLTGCRIIEPVYRLKAPLSPLAAMRLENKVIDFDKLHIPDAIPLIVEGAGGVMVPITEDKMMLDLFQDINIPIVVVARGQLGTLNHTLLTVNCLQKAGLSVHAIIISGKHYDNNGQLLQELTNIPVYHLPKLALNKPFDSGCAALLHRIDKIKA